MDNKTFDSKRYKRMLQISNDPAWMTKYAEVENEEKRFRFPTVKTFIDVLIYANKIPYQDDVKQGLLGYLVAKELAEFYRANLDMAQPAFKSYKPETDLQKSLADDLYSFERADLKNLRDGLTKSIRAVGDIHVASLSKEVDGDKLNDLIDFALTRAYILSYWHFLFENPLVTVIIENEGVADKLTIFSALTKHQLEKDAAGDVPDPVDLGVWDPKNVEKLYDTRPEDIREEEREQGFDPDDTAYLEKDKEDIKIQELPGKKIRLSKLIEAFRVSRAKWALKIISDPDEPQFRSAWVNTDANLDYLERSYAALKEFVKVNPNNRFLKWHGQRIGDGDVFVTTTGANFNTLKMMSPPSFRTDAPKVKTFVPETGETILETPPDALRIPVKHWDPEKQGNDLALFLPDFEDIYSIYIHQKMGNATKYRREMEEKTLSDLRVASVHKWSNTVESPSFFAQDSLAKDSIMEILVDFNEAGEEIQIDPKKAEEVCNYIWKQLHKSIDMMLTSSATLGDFEQALQDYKKVAVNVFYGDPKINKHLPEGGQVFLANAIKFAIVNDLEYPENISSFTNRFTQFAQIYSAPKSYQAQINQFTKASDGVECYNDIMMRVRVEIDKKDQQLGFVPGDNALRNPAEYQVLWAQIYADVYQRFARFLRRDGKDPNKISSSSADAIRKLVEIVVEHIFPDAAAPVDLNKSPVDLKKRAERLYYSSKGGKGGNLYTNTQAKMLRDILTSPHFENQYDFDESLFDKTQLELSNREQKKKVFYEVQGAYKELLRRNKEMNGKLFPTKPDPQVLKEMTKGLNPASADGMLAYQKQYGYAFVETVRRWIVENMGEDDDRLAKIKHLLSEQPSGNSLSMGLFAILGKNVAVCLLPDIEKTTLERFPAGGKARGVVGAADELYQSDAEKAEAGSAFGYRYDEIDSHRSNMAELQAKALMRESLEPDGGRAQFINAKHEAANEIEQFLHDQMEYLFKTVRTRKVRYETVEQAQKKPRVALSTNTFGGFIQQLFQSRSPYLKEYMEDPRKFRTWFKVSAAASFGNQIGERVKNQLSQLWAGPNAKYESIEDFMEQVGAFADPIWAISPMTKALGSREIQKRKSGYISDTPDTAEDHLWRAAYNMNSLDPAVAEDLIKAYFHKRADSVASAFEGADPRLVKQYLIKRFKRDPGAGGRINNPTNNPFGNMTMDEMKRIFNNVGITPESLELYFSQLKAESDEARRLEIGHIDHALTDLGEEKDIAERQKLAAQLENATQYKIDGRAATSDWILDNCSTAGLSEEDKVLLLDAVKQIKAGLKRLIGTDPTQHLKIYGDMHSWREAIEGVMGALDNRYESVKRLVVAQMDKTHEMAGVRDSILKQYEQKVLGMEDDETEDDMPPASSDEIVKDFKDKQPKEEKKSPPKTVVRRRKDEKVETVDGRDISDAMKAEPSKGIPAFEELAKALERRVQELKTELFAYMSFEGLEEVERQVGETDFAGERQYIPEQDVRMALANIKRYTEYLRGLRPEDVKNPSGFDTMPQTIKGVELLGANELVEKFSLDGFGERIQIIQQGFGVNKLAGDTQLLNKILKSGLGNNNNTYVFNV